MGKFCDNTIELFHDFRWDFAIPVPGDKRYSIEQKIGGEYSRRQQQDGIFLSAG